MSYGNSLRNHAFKLRKSGHSYNYIAEHTGIAKGTLHGWLSRVPYVPNSETVRRIGNARAASGRSKAKEKLESIRTAQRRAKEDIGTLTERDLFMLGIGVYIGEGTKSYNIVRVINSDPRIIKMIIRWFQKICNLPKENFKIRLHLYPDNNPTACLKFWSKTVGIPLSQFQKIQIDKRKNKKMFKRGKLPYGTAHLSVLSKGKKEFGVSLSRRIMGWIDEVLK